MCTCVCVIHRKVTKAKKEYNDDGWEWIKEWIDDGCCVGTYRKPQKITFAEGRILVAHRNKPKPHKILPGEVYQHQFNKMDGDTYTFRMNQKLYEIACKYDLFPEC